MPALALISPRKPQQRRRHRHARKHRRKRRPVHAHRRHPQLAVDQHPVQEPVHQVRRHIRHGNHAHLAHALQIPPRRAIEQQRQRAPQEPPGVRATGLCQLRGDSQPRQPTQRQRWSWVELLPQKRKGELRLTTPRTSHSDMVLAISSALVSTKVMSNPQSSPRSADRLLVPIRRAHSGVGWRSITKRSIPGIHPSERLDQCGDVLCRPITSPPRIRASFDHLPLMSRQFSASFSVVNSLERTLWLSNPPVLLPARSTRMGALSFRFPLVRLQMWFAAFRLRPRPRIKMACRFTFSCMSWRVCWPSWRCIARTQDLFRARSTPIAFGS